MCKGKDGMQCKCGGKCECEKGDKGNGKILDWENPGGEMLLEAQEVLEKYKIPTKYLDKVVKTHFKRKAWVGTLLPFDASGRIVIPLSVEPDDRPWEANVQRVLMGVDERLKPLGLMFMSDGKRKMRTTRLIAKHWDALKSTQAIVDTIKVYDSEKMTRHATNWTGSSFGAEYGQRIVNGRSAIISVNPYDFFTASEENTCGYSSCIRPNGEYFNTIMTNLGSGCVLIAYTVENTKMGYKVGRCWVYLDKNAIFTGRIFGTMSNYEQLAIRDFMQECFGGEWAACGTLKENQACSVDDGDFPGYIDYGFGVLTVRKGATWDSFGFNTGTCLECGCDLDSSDEQRGVCYDCLEKIQNRRICVDCGDEINTRRDRFWRVNNGEALCEGCYENGDYFLCNSCNIVFHIDDAHEESGRDHRYCPDCASVRLRECYECGETYNRSRGENLCIAEDGNSSHFVCNNCRSLYYECGCCGGMTSGEMHDVPDGEMKHIYVCEQCFDGMTPCDCCGQLNTTVGTGRKVVSIDENGMVTTGTATLCGPCTDGAYTTVIHGERTRIGEDVRLTWVLIKWEDIEANPEMVRREDSIYRYLYVNDQITIERMSVCLKCGKVFVNRCERDKHMKGCLRDAWENGECLYGYGVIYSTSDMDSYFAEVA